MRYPLKTTFFCENEYGQEEVIGNALLCAEMPLYSPERNHTLFLFQALELADHKVSGTGCDMRVDFCSHRTVSFRGEVETVEDIGNRYSLMHFMDRDDAAKPGTVACMIALETIFKDVDRPWLANYRDRLDIYLRACLHLNYPAAMSHAFPAMVNGDHICDCDTFLCEFGSALFGHAGYMGQDLDGFFDVLNDLQNPVTIIWASSKEAMARMEKTWPYKHLTLTQLVRDMRRYCDLKLC